MIQKIIIDNFKSIKHIEFNISNFTVLVGNNGAGKTNILKAIKLIAQLAGNKQISEVLKELQLLPKELFFTPENPVMKFEIDLLLEGIPIDYRFEISQEKNENNYSYKILNEFLSNGSPDHPILQRTGEQIIIYRKDGTKMVHSLVTSQLSISAIPDPEIITKVKKFLSSIFVDSFEPHNLREVGNVSKITTGIEQNFAENLYSLTKTNQVRFKELEQEAKSMIKGLNSINVGVSEQEGRLIVMFKEEDLLYNMSFFSLSDGNLRSLGILSALMVDPKPSVLAIDEIENSMHPTRIRELVKFFEYVSQKEENNLQIIFSTHSPVVINHLNDQDIQFVYKHNNETKLAGKPSKNKKVLKYLENASESGLSLGDLYAQGILEKLYRTES